MNIRILRRQPRCLNWFAWTGLPLLILLAGLSPRPGAGQTLPLRVEPGGIAIETNPQVFAVLSALSAAGLNVGSAAADIDPAFEQLRADLPRSNGPAAEALRQFYRDHQLGGPNENLSRYISFALVVGPPPRFSYLLSHDQLPPDVLSIEGFQDVLGHAIDATNQTALSAELSPNTQDARTRIALDYLKENMVTRADWQDDIAKIHQRLDELEGLLA